MSMKLFHISVILLLLISIPAVSGLNVVATTSVLADPVEYIGGEHLKVITIADPTICPHMQGDIITSRIQMNAEFIAGADLFVAHRSSMDKDVVMPAVERFMDSNGYGTVDWKTLQSPYAAWNTPDDAGKLAEEVKGWLIEADPTNATDYEDRCDSYCDLIEAYDLSDKESLMINGQDAVVMVWQQDASENWLGLNVVDIYAPEFYKGGEFTAKKLVDAINENPEKYRNVCYVIENMQSGEMGKGVEEALHDHGIMAERVIFTNFPKSVEGAESIPDVLAYNKALITPDNFLNVVATTSVLADPVAYIGGEHAEVITIADPTICPHMQGDIITSRIQQNTDFIAGADLFVAHRSSMDKGVVMPAVEKFMDSNGYGTVDWKTLQNPYMAWNTPDDARNLAEEVKGWLVEAQPWNEDYFEERFDSYSELIDETELSGDETERVSGQDVIVMVWQQEAAEGWLDLNVVDIYAPDFYKGGEFTAKKLVDRIKAEPEKYADVHYVIENMQSGEMGKGVEEALHDEGIQAQRVIFTNFPKSVEGADSIPEMLAYNKYLVTPTWRPARCNDGSGDRSISLRTEISADEDTEFVLDDTPFSQITVRTSEDVESMMITAKWMTDLPKEIPGPEYEVFGYVMVSPQYVTDDQIRNATIEFSIPIPWITFSGMENRDVALMRYHNNTWQQLKTEFLYENLDLAHYSASSPGFSYFAIAFVEGGAEVTEIKTPEPTIVPASNPTKTRDNVTRPTETATSIATEEPTPEKTTTQTQTPETPLSTWVPVLALLIAVVAVIRRD